MPHSNVYIRGVPIGFDTEDLRYLFEGYGTIISVKILEPRHIGDKRLGFVKFASQNEASSAIRAMDKRVIGGQCLEVREAEFDVDPKKNLLDKALVENDNLFVRGFPSYWASEQLTEYFSQFGIVVSVRVLNSAIPARGGVGLVRYSSVDEARETIAQLNGATVEGFGPMTVKYSTVKEQKLRCRRMPFRKNIVSASIAYRHQALCRTAASCLALDCDATMNNGVEPKLESSPEEEISLSKAVFVCNLPPTATELRLYREFAPYGAISSINIGLDMAQMCTGMAFVNYIVGQDAERAAEHLNGAAMDGMIISVSDS